jgi:hypothetical protein
MRGIFFFADEEVERGGDIFTGALLVQTRGPTIVFAVRANQSRSIKIRRSKTFFANVAWLDAQPRVLN